MKVTYLNCIVLMSHILSTLLNSLGPKQTKLFLYQQFSNLNEKYLKAKSARFIFFIIIKIFFEKM